MEDKAKQCKEKLEQTKQKTENPKAKEAIEKKLAYFNKPMNK